MTTDAKVALVRQAIFTVLDEREWDFADDEQRVDFADRVIAFIPAAQPLTDEQLSAIGAAVPAGRGYSERRDRAIADAASDSVLVRPIPTPRTDAECERNDAHAGHIKDAWIPSDFARQLEQELYWAKERIAELTAEAKNMLAGYNACNEDWRKAEEQLALAERKLTYLRSQRSGEMGEKLYKLEQELAERDEQLMRWFKAASPYATPGSLEAALRGHINVTGPLTASEIEELRRQAKSALDPDHLPGRYDERVDRLCDMAKRALPSAPPADDTPIDSTIKPSAWD